MYTYATEGKASQVRALCKSVCDVCDRRTSGSRSLVTSYKRAYITVRADRRATMSERIEIATDRCNEPKLISAHRATRNVDKLRARIREIHPPAYPARDMSASGFCGFSRVCTYIYMYRYMVRMTSESGKSLMANVVVLLIMRATLGACGIYILYTRVI